MAKRKTSSSSKTDAPSSEAQAPEAEVSTFEDALEAGYFGHAPGNGNDHTVTASSSTSTPEGEPTGTDNGANTEGG